MSQFQLLTSPPLRGEFFEGARSPLPRQKKPAKPLPGTKIHVRKSSKAPPQGRTRLKKLIKYTLKRYKNVLKMGISIKQNHLLQLKYSLHISETVFRIVVLISIDTCITAVLRSYTLKLRENVEKTNQSDNLASYLDLTFTIEKDGKFSTKLYDKRNDFDFHIVSFPIPVK